ncbi:MAG: GntR family transcriptional regulator [Thermoguttaceae bacterium]|nr:GntR family transcriptional regulator [Thermoguttaceae bacterium]
MYQINFNSVVPIYEQIVRQARLFIASGALPEGSLIPSVRETAKSLAINPQTVVKAYMFLKNDGLIQSVRGQGFVVSPGSQERCRHIRLSFFQERLEETIREAVVGKTPLDEIRASFEAALKKVVADYQPETHDADANGGM